MAFLLVTAIGSQESQPGSSFIITTLLPHIRVLDWAGSAALWSICCAAGFVGKIIAMTTSNRAITGSCSHLTNPNSNTCTIYRACYVLVALHDFSIRGNMFCYLTFVSYFLYDLPDSTNWKVHTQQNNINNTFSLKYLFHKCSCRRFSVLYEFNSTTPSSCGSTHGSIYHIIWASAFMSKCVCKMRRYSTFSIEQESQKKSMRKLKALLCAKNNTYSSPLELCLGPWIVS